MNNESVEVQLALLAREVRTILEELSEAKIGRKDQYEKIEKLSIIINTMNGRVENVETKLATASPTIEEFITIKHKIVGAGKIGKWLWVVGAALIGWAAASKDVIGAWLK